MRNCQFTVYVDNAGISRVFIDTVIEKKKKNKKKNNLAWVMPTLGLSLNTDIDINGTLNRYRNKHTLWHCVTPLVFLDALEMCRF